MYRSAMLDSKYPFELPPLPYAYDSLEPFIDEETMYYHHDKHFAAYINNLNELLNPYPLLQGYTLRQLLTRPIGLAEPKRQQILNNAGGVFNHDEFFLHLGPVNGVRHAPHDQLLDMINISFGSFTRFKELFTARAKSIFGSGWAQLCLTRQGKLKIVALKNQDTVIRDGSRPLILFDVWEHAYYLKYKNDRAEYISNLWNVVIFPEL